MLRFEQEEFISYLSKLVTHQEQASQGSNHELLASDCAVLPCVAKLFGGRPLGIYQRVYAETFASACVICLNVAQVVVTRFWNGVHSRVQPQERIHDFSIT